jgi:hypothetical protein
MRSRSIRFIVVLFALALLACSDRGGGESARSSGASEADGRDRALTVRLSLAVDDVEARTAAVRTLLARHDGYVDHATTSGEHASLVLRVPVAELEALRVALRGLGELRHEEEQAEDVTEQRADTGARLRSARREEERLLELLSMRTASLADVIAVEQRLASVRERIEQLEASERALTQRVELAVVHVDLSLQGVPFWREPIATLRDAAAWGVEAAAAIVVGASALVAGAGPTYALFVGVLALSFVALRTLGRRRWRA